MSKWQPIETAKKEDRLVDVWAVTHWARDLSVGDGWRIPNARWDTGREAWMSGSSMIEVDDNGKSVVVTHWMPIAEPPAS